MAGVSNQLAECKPEELQRLQGELAAYKRLLNLKNTLRSDKFRQSSDEKENE